LDREVSINFQIEHQCPQCGAPALLEETDRLFACQYCRVNSYLMPDDFFRYVLPHATQTDQDLIYFPFWRFKGMLFFCGPSGITNRFVDVSHQAIETPQFPISVGVRSQAMKLRFLSADTKGRFLKPKLPFEQIAANFENRFGKTVPKPIMHHAHIGESLSLIYSPFYVKDKLYDAIIDKPASTQAWEDFNIEDLDGVRSGWHIRFVSTLCPNCGWNLEGQRDSLVVLCKNCNSAWYPVRCKLKQLKFARIPKTDDNTLYLPFWRLQADISGIDLQSYADLVRIANLPKAVQDGWQDIPFRFWIPAFKIRPQLFLRLASHITVSQPNEELIPELPAGRIYPITLPVKEAIESLMVTLADLMKPRRKMMERFHDIHVKALSFTLVFVPFNEEHHEFIHHEYQIAINKNIITHSKNL
jgi:hypothetical protein